MSEETAQVEPENVDPAESNNEGTEEITQPKPRKRGAGKAKTRKPRFKDWIRVEKSSGNNCENTTIFLKINEATGIVELITNAPAKEGSSDMEGEKVQVFKITSYEVINEPDYNPVDESKPKAKKKKSKSNEEDEATGAKEDTGAAENTESATEATQG